MFFMKWIATEMKIYKRTHFIKEVEHTLSALGVTASYAWRKMLKRNVWRISFPRTVLSGIFSWISSQHLITQLNLDSYLQLFTAANKKPWEVLRKYLLLLHWSGNKPVSADQLPFTDHQRNGFPLGTELCPSVLKTEVPLKFNSTFRNPSWDI